MNSDKKEKEKSYIHICTIPGTGKYYASISSSSRERYSRRTGLKNNVSEIKDQCSQQVAYAWYRAFYTLSNTPWAQYTRSTYYTELGSIYLIWSTRYSGGNMRNIMHRSRVGASYFPGRINGGTASTGSMSGVQYWYGSSCKYCEYSRRGYFRVFAISTACGYCLYFQVLWVVRYCGYCCCVLPALAVARADCQTASTANVLVVSSLLIRLREYSGFEALLLVPGT